MSTAAQQFHCLLVCGLPMLIGVAGIWVCLQRELSEKVRAYVLLMPTKSFPPQITDSIIFCVPGIVCVIFAWAYLRHTQLIFIKFLK